MKSNGINTPVQDAIEAFWRSAASSFPQIKSGDLDPVTTLMFEAAATAVITEWLSQNRTCGNVKKEGCDGYVFQ